MMTRKEIQIYSIILILIIGMDARALSTDKDQPIEIEADRAELDDINNVTVYYGDVIVVQGSIRMTGDKMTVYHTPDDELDTVIMVGKPATYRQLPDNSEIYDEAEALIMEYYELKSYVILKEEAVVTQEGLKFSGKRIEYDTLNSRVKAESGVSHTIDKKEDEVSTGKKPERVKIIIKKKKKEE